MSLKALFRDCVVGIKNQMFKYVTDTMLCQLAKVVKLVGKTLNKALEDLAVKVCITHLLCIVLKLRNLSIDREICIAILWDSWNNNSV